jgi:hypothetical protein
VRLVCSAAFSNGLVNFSPFAVAIRSVEIFRLLFDSVDNGISRSKHGVDGFSSIFVYTGQHFFVALGLTMAL